MFSASEGAQRPNEEDVLRCSAIRFSHAVGEFHHDVGCLIPLVIAGNVGAILSEGDGLLDGVEVASLPALHIHHHEGFKSGTEL